MAGNCDEILKQLCLDHLIEHFREQKMDREVLLSINNEELKELVPQVGCRIKLKNYIAAAKTGPCTISNHDSMQEKSIVHETMDELGTVTILHDNDFGICKELEINVSAPSVTSYSSLCAGSKVEHHVGSSKNQDNNDDIASLPEETDVSFTSTVSVDLSDGDGKTESDRDICNPMKKLKCTPQFFLGDKTVLEFINSSCKTRAIYQEYQLNNCLKRGDRARLVAAIIDGVLERHCAVKREFLEELANCIIEVFPTEEKSAYFIYDRKVCKDPRGKLVYRYFNEVKRRKSSLASKKSASCLPITNTDLEDENSNQKYIWLKYSVSPWSQVVQYWVETYAIQKSDLESNEPHIHKLIEKWPILQNENAHVLVSSLICHCQLNF